MDIRIFIAIGGIGALLLVVAIVMFLLPSKKSDKKSDKESDKQESEKKTDEDSEKKKAELAESYEKMMQDDVYHIFSKEFHEELRNKARLDFQKVISENAMFLQQDLRLTTSEINDFLKKEISGKLQEEFAAYQQSIKDVQQAAVDSINDTVASAQQQQALLIQKMQEDTNAQKTKIMSDFEQNMAEIVNQYILAAVGNEIDLRDQLPFILREMEAQKDNMKKDMLL